MKLTRKPLLLLVALTCALAAWAQRKPAQVFITAGQSNADGRAYLSEGLPAYLKDGYRYLQFANVTATAHDHFYPRVFSPDSEGGRFAFSDVTNYWIEQALKADFYGVKCAFGGTAIALGQTVEKLPCWNASEAYIDTTRAYRGTVGTGTSLAKSLTEGFKGLADRVLSKLEQGYDVKAITWHQGESDRKAGDAYYDNLKTLITYLRTEIYKVTGDTADLALPFVMGTVSPKSRQYNADVERARQQLAQDMPHVYVINLDDAGLRQDHIHFDAPWTEYFGKLVYNKLVAVGAVDGKTIEAVKPGSQSTEQPTVKPVRRWDFAKEQWSSETLNKLEAFGNYNSGYGYRNKATMTAEPFVTDGYQVPETNGLKFTVSRTNRLGLHPDRHALCLVSDEARIIVPQVKPGQFVYVKGATAKAGTRRGIVATGNARNNLDVIAGDTISDGIVESVYWVQDSYTAPVDAEFTASGGTSYVYEISVSDSDPNQASSVTPTAVKTLTQEKKQQGDTMYNVAGLRVGAHYRGIVIAGGRKVLRP